ncbi:competence/damage-inducible protein A [Gloeobacter morelensis]|uniref:CinA-like protein n=1 Tax=Gloeobacter morelensis MG652769 TaxID=2781736 RepID=A0ABY3PSP4_9CYAN|nr:competence/damage-inducible protein A [Gloeobacter morelensis]UFP96474.1 competence/damage-inducible protein A [Gloeobacter morelensis MG652769]
MAPSAEILCIGTELLLGQIVNTNAQFLAGELAKLGIPHHFQTVVGDNPGRIRRALALAVERAGIILTTGGLGPTDDDLTHQTLAEHFEVPLVRHPAVLALIEERFRERNRSMSPTNAKQADLPEGAQILPNPMGTAPGIIWEPKAGVAILTFPGVPAEMRAMWAETAVPFLCSRGWGQEIFYSRTLRHWGISESTLAERVGAFLQSVNPTVAPYAGNGEVKLRITARAADIAAAESLIAPIEASLRAIAGLDCYGADEETLASVSAALLVRTGTTLAVAESCTGGMLAEALTALPGASRYLRGAVVAYANDLKTSLLGVDEQRMIDHGAVSEPVARAMAEGVRKRLASDWGLALTGVSGPGGGTAQKPVGLVYIALAGPAETRAVEIRLGAQRGRDWIRRVSTQSALDLLRREIINREAFGIMKER